MTHMPRLAASRGAAYIFGIGAAAYLVAVLHRTALGVASVDAAARFDIEATALAMLAVLQIAVYALIQVPAGLLLDRWGPARVIVIGSLVLAVGQAMMAFAPGFWWALGARVLIGAGDAPIFIAVTRLISIHFPPHRVPVMVQVAGLIGMSGQLATTIPFAWALRVAGWERAFGGLAVVGLLVAVVVFFALVRPTLGEPREKGAAFSLAEAMRTHWHTPGVRLGFWSHFLGPFSSNAIALLWGVPFFTMGHGASKAEASALLTVLVVANIVAGPVLGVLTARHPLRRSWLVLGGAVMTAGAWVAVLIPSEPLPLWQLTIFVAVIGAGGPASLIGMDFARSFAVQHRAGSATGFVNMGGFLATVIAVLLVGVVLQIASPPGATDYALGEFRLAFASLALPWLVGVIGVIRSRRGTRAVMAADGVVVPTIREVWQRYRER